MGGIHWNTLLNPPKKSWHPFPFWQWQLFGNIWSSIPSLNWTTFDFIWYLWHRLPGQRIAQMARGGILEQLTETWTTNIYMNWQSKARPGDGPIKSENGDVIGIFLSVPPLVKPQERYIECFTDIISFECFTDTLRFLVLNNQILNLIMSVRTSFNTSI